MSFKSVLKPENSLVMGAAVVGLVYATYQGSCGSMATAQATEAANVNLAASKKKAGWTSVILVAGLGVLAKDPNIVILGSAAIIAMESGYLHAIHTNPDSGRLQLPAHSAYEPAQNVVPINAQGPNVAYGA